MRQREEKGKEERKELMRKTRQKPVRGATRPGGSVAAALIVMAAAAFALGSPALAVPPMKPGNLNVTVVLEGEVSFESAAIYVHDRTQPLEKGQNVFLFKELIPRNYAVTVDAKVKQGWLKPNLRYVGVQEAAVMPGRTEEVTVTLVPVENMNDFCVRCHPDPGQPAQPGLIRRDLHVSGKVLEKKYRDRVKTYNDRVAEQKKKGLPHNQPIVLEERVVDEKGNKIKKIFYTCESCHTLHWKSAPRSYTVAPYKEGNDLCNGCHL